MHRVFCVEDRRPFTKLHGNTKMNFLFGKKKEDVPAAAQPSDAVTKMREQEQAMEKRMAFLQKKIDDEVLAAKTKAKAGDRRAAMMALKKKKTYEQQQENLANQQFNLSNQVQMIESAQMMKAQVDALRLGKEQMVSLQNEINVDQVDDLMDELRDAADDMEDINAAMQQPFGAGLDIDEDELGAELDALEEDLLDERLVSLDQPAGPLPAAPDATVVPAAPAPAPAAAADDEAAELAALEAEITM